MKLTKEQEVVLNVIIDLEDENESTNECDISRVSPYAGHTTHNVLRTLYRSGIVSTNDDGEYSVNEVCYER